MMSADTYSLYIDNEHGQIQEANSSFFIQNCGRWLYQKDECLYGVILHYKLLMQLKCGCIRQVAVGQGGRFRDGLL